ncbi:MAG: GIY-YIG nuclease family protein [Calditrichaeota bacterium]|nr:MAG: GIY-YIG nuclease family protein [Calditrichota bacterium]
MKRAWVYILKCSDGTYYTGSTTNIDLRIKEHQLGEGAEWTKKRLPIEVLFTQEMPDEDSAYLAEQKVKKWSGAKKEVLIASDWDLLQYLAKKLAFRMKK